jgi:hypothetical protein
MWQRERVSVCECVRVRVCACVFECMHVCVCVCVLRMHPHCGMRVRIFVPVGCMWLVQRVRDARDHAGVRGISLCVHVSMCRHMRMQCVHACRIHMHACCAGMDKSMCSIACRIIMCSIMRACVCEMCVCMHACLLPVLACAWLYAYVCMHSAIRMYALCVYASNLCSSECREKHACACL